MTKDTSRRTRRQNGQHPSAGGAATRSWRRGRRRQIKWVAVVGAAAMLTLGLPDVVHRLVGRAAPLDARQEIGTPNPGSPSDRLSISEESATEVLRNLKGFRNNFYTKAYQLYEGRWTPDPGWPAIVDGFPNRVADGGWSCSLNELGSDTLIFAESSQDLSTLRRGDRVLVTGRIRRVSPLGSVTLEEASISRADP